MKLLIPDVPIGAQAANVSEARITKCLTSAPPQKESRQKEILQGNCNARQPARLRCEILLSRRQLVLCSQRLEILIKAW